MTTPADPERGLPATEAGGMASEDVSAAVTRALEDTPDEFGMWDRRPRAADFLAALARQGRGYIVVPKPDPDDKYFLSPADFSPEHDPVAVAAVRFCCEHEIDWMSPHCFACDKRVQRA